MYKGVRVQLDELTPVSSNCTLNVFANNVHRTTYGFHSNDWEDASMAHMRGSRKEREVEEPE